MKSEQPSQQLKLNLLGRFFCLQGIHTKLLLLNYWNLNNTIVRNWFIWMMHWKKEDLFKSREKVNQWLFHGNIHPHFANTCLIWNRKTFHIVYPPHTQIICFDLCKTCYLVFSSNKLKTLINSSVNSSNQNGNHPFMIEYTK